MCKDREPIVPISFDESLIKKEVKFTVQGKPFGKQRPRFVRRGKFTSTYTPKETVEYEEKVKKSYLDQVGDIKLRGAIDAKMVGTFPIPQSISKKQKNEILAGNVKYTKKIDCDNMAKSILDALNEIAYDDDSQVYKLLAAKKYGVEPKVEVILREVREDYSDVM